MFGINRGGCFCSGDDWEVWKEEFGAAKKRVTADERTKSIKIDILVSTVYVIPDKPIVQST